MSEVKLPKNGIDNLVILGNFGYPWLIPAVWNKYDGKWCGAIVQSSYCDGVEDTYLENQYFEDDELLSWQSMPELTKK